MTAPLPAICDRCLAEGRAGEAPFEAFGALLDFDPVPRRSARADGWDEELQRAFIALLALTGAVATAARALGKSAFGITQLVRAEGSESFVAAMDEAIAISKDERSRRIAEAIRAVASDKDSWTPPRPSWDKARRAAPAPAAGRKGRPPERERLAAAEAAAAASAPPPADPLDNDLPTIATLVDKYLLKLEAERSCRLAGRIAEADFYLRQVTMLEVAIDVVGGDGMAVLKAARLGGHGLLAIAETTASKILDEARRAHFDRCGDPPRPMYPPLHLLVRHEGCSTEPGHSIAGGTPESSEEQQRRYEEQCARDAEAQVEWEAAARRDYKERGGEGEPPTEAELAEREAAGVARLKAFGDRFREAIGRGAPAGSPKDGGEP